MNLEVGKELKAEKELKPEHICRLPIAQLVVLY